jgi:hypothetical protein
METVCLSETLVRTYDSKWRHNPEEQNDQCQRHENLKFHIIYLYDMWYLYFTSLFHEFVLFSGRAEGCWCFSRIFLREGVVGGGGAGGEFPLSSHFTVRPSPYKQGLLWKCHTSNIKCEKYAFIWMPILHVRPYEITSENCIAGICRGININFIHDIYST